VFVGLGIHHAMRMNHIIIYGLLGLEYLFILSSKKFI